MFYVLQNESTAALRRVPILLTDAATGTTAQTGVGLSTIFPYVNINGGAFAGGAGTVAEAGYGQYYYEFDASEIATLGLAGIHITASGCRDYDAIVQVAAFNVYSGAGVGITAGDVWSYVISSGDSADVTLSNTYNQASNAAAQTSSSSIRDAVWDTDLSYLNPSTQAAGILYQAAAGTTLNAPSEVWSYATRTLTAGGGATAGDIWTYDISAITTAGTAGSQLNAAAAGGAGLTAGDVWAFDITGFGATGSAALYATNTNFTVNNIETYVQNQTPQDIWTYAGLEGRTITGGIADTVTSVINTVDISTQSVTDIWSEDVSGYSTPSAGYDLTQASTGVGLTAGDVWSYATRTLTSGSGISAADVWNYTLTSSGQSADATLGNVDTNVTTIQGNTSNIPADVWTYVTRTLTSAAGATAGDIWSYAGGRTITGGSVTTVVNGVTVTTNNDKTGYSLSGTQSFNLTGNITGNLSGSVGSVTNAVDITTTAMSGVAGSVWNYATRTLTAGGGVTAGDIWSYAGGRTITGGSVTSVVDPVSITTTAMSGVAGSVWNSAVASYSTNGTFGKNILRADAANKVGDVTLYSAGGINGVDADVHRIANDTTAATSLKDALTGVGASWTGNVVGNVTGSVASVTNPVTVSTTSMSGIANTVWTAATKTITGGTVDNVTNPVAVTTTSMSGIAGTVWTYSPRTITSGAGATAGDIWTYNIASISTSGSAGKQLNDAAVSGSVVTVVNGPYVLTSIAEGTDGQLDILRNSVQTIQLNLVDGNGSPFNIGGNYTVSVDVYDVSGALTATYTPTVEFAGNGIISFDIDTDVTGTDGRYTLVVSLTDGDVIKLGPLNILVRPL